MPSQTVGIRRGLPRPSTRAIPRLAINATLDEGRPLTVLAAPAGYGKTTAVAQWAESRLDEQDSVVWVDMSYLATCEDLITRLAELSVGHHASSGNAASVLDRFLVTTPGVVLVLDAFPGERDDLLATVVSLLRAHRQLRAVVCARTVPNMARVARDLDYRMIGGARLQFGEEEVLRLATAQGVACTPEDARALVAFAEGWPAWTRVGLDLLGENRALTAEEWADRLAAELWRDVEARHPSDRSSWLLTVGNLGAFDEPIARRLAGEGAARHIEHLVPLGLLIPEAGAAGDRLRPHILVALVAHQAAVAAPPQAVSPRRAALAKELIAGAVAAGDLLTAFREALFIGDDEVLRELTAGHWLELLRDEGLTERVFARLRTAGTDGNADLEAALSWHELWTQVGAVLQGREAPPTPSQLRVAADQDELMLQMFEVIGHRSAGRIGASDAAGRALLAAAARTQKQHLADGTPSLVPLVVMHVVVTRQLTSDWVSSLPILLTLQRSGLQDLSGFTERNVQGALAHLLALSGDIRAARSCAAAEAQHPPQGWWIERRLATQGNLGRLWVAMEELDQERAEEIVPILRRQRDDDELWPHIVEALLTYELLWGDPEIAATELRALSRRLRGKIELDGYAPLALARLAIDSKLARGQAAGVSAIFEHFPDQHPWLVTRRARLDLVAGRIAEVLNYRLEPGKRTARDRMELDLTQAAALSRLGRIEEARDKARRVATVARRSEMVLPLAYLPPSDRRALTALSTELAAVLDPIADRLPVLVGESAPLVELSERERAVLHCLAAGRTRDEMAVDLFVSVNTIKTQLRSVYRKMDAADRNQALAQARVLGFL